MRVAQSGRALRVLALACVAGLTLSACGNGDKVPQLMNLRSNTDGPDEFAILPSKPLELPEDLTALPDPTPGQGNLTDPDPKADAIAALGGQVREAGGIPAGDAGLTNYAGRNGVTADIRGTLAAEDLAFRQKNDARLLERIFDLNVYFRVYSRQTLDQHAELARWRRAGARTPSAPPPKDGE
jgi:hypothetical protein